MKDVALISSVVGNIIQAIDKASTQREAVALRRALKEWQKAYSSLKRKADNLEREFMDLNKAFSVQKGEINRLKSELSAKDEEISKLKKRMKN